MDKEEKITYCKKHPNFSGKNKPKTECLSCWYLYYSYSKENDIKEKCKRIIK